MLKQFVLLFLLGIFVFCSSCALFDDPYSYRDDPDFLDGRYYVSARTLNVDLDEESPPFFDTDEIMIGKYRILYSALEKLL
jgi:hypothetical protein